MERLGLDASWLAPLIVSSTVAGVLTQAAAAELGLRAGVPVVAGGSDTACAALGSGLVRAGTAQLTVGTGAQLILVRDTPDDASARGVHLYRTVTGSPYYALAAIQNGGLALEWARRSLRRSWEDLYELAFSVPSSSGANARPI